MKRIYPAFAYGPGPRRGCWWDETVTPCDWPEQAGDLSADVVIVGAGFTGLNAALELARQGANVAVLDAGFPGFGASGRNGGFCCLGGGRLSHRDLVDRFGATGAADWYAAEREAVSHVRDMLDRHEIDADVHSQGETQLAHNSRKMDALRKDAEHIEKHHGVALQVIEAPDLAAHGLNGPFHGAVTNPIGFALNPRRYLEGLLQVARSTGVRIFGQSAVLSMGRAAGRIALRTRRGQVRANQVLIATNGYSSEDLPDWMAARFMPTQSTVLVTRPLTEAELSAQGWTSAQMCYDTLNLLHYFRLMPDRRFLFGMRGGLVSAPWAEARARRAVRRDFERMFPAWSRVKSQHIWSGFVCLSRKNLPFVGPVPGHPGVFASFAYHGNGVAMGSYCGMRAGQLIGGMRTELPAALTASPGKFPLGATRRLLMPPAYALKRLADL